MLYRTHRFSIILYICIIFSIITEEEGHIYGIVITQQEEDYEVVKSSAKAAIIQHLDDLETLINHVAEQERLTEEHEQARKQAVARMRRKRKRILRHNDVYCSVLLLRRSGVE